MALTRFGTEWGGRRIEVQPISTWDGRQVRLLVDGEERTVAKSRTKRLRAVVDDDAEVHVWVGFTGESILRAELRVAGEEPIALTPEPGTREARREAWAQRHPALYAARHVVGSVAPILLGVLGINLLLRLIPLPSIDLPDVDLPSIPLPSIDLPDWNIGDLIPGWMEPVLEVLQVAGPILAGIVLAVLEYRRRRRQRERARAPAGTPAGTD